MTSTIPEGWKRISLGDLGRFTTSSVDKLIQPGERPVQLVNYMDVYRHRRIDRSIELMQVTASEDEVARYQVQVGDILFTPSSETPDDIGHSAVVADELPETVHSYHTVRLRPDGRIDLDLEFCGWMANNENVLRYFANCAAGSTRYTLGLGRFVSATLDLPPISEQGRIAEILSTLDEAIAQTEALIAKHQQIKAGLMHDLFTRGVTSDGHLRPTREQAPDLYKKSPLGWIPKEWDAKPLSAVVEFWDGKRVPLKEDDRSKMSGQIPYYGASGIIDYIDKWLFDDELILLGEDGENIVSRNLPLAFKVIGKCWVNNHAHVLKPKASHSISYWMEQLEWKDYTPLTSGSAQPKITQGKLTNMMVVVPSFAEQEAISKRAEYMAEHLATERAFLEKLSLQKHGLMHDLLTGRVRVRLNEVEVSMV